MAASIDWFGYARVGRKTALTYSVPLGVAWGGLMADRIRVSSPSSLRYYKTTGSRSGANRFSGLRQTGPAKSQQRPQGT